MQPFADVGDADVGFAEQFGGEMQFPAADEFPGRCVELPAHEPVNGCRGKSGAVSDPVENIVVFEMAVDFADDQLQL